MKTVLLLLLIITPVAAQTLQVDGGSSTLFGSSGGGVHFYTANSTIYAGAGLQNGHVVYGFSDTFRRKGVDFTLGDRQFGFSFDGAGLSLVERGVSAQWQTDRTTVSGFAGAASFGYFSPYLQTAGASQFGAGFYLRQRLGERWELNSLQVVQGGWNFTSLEGFGYEDRHLTVTAAAGLLESKGYLVGQAMYHYSPLTVTVSHQKFGTASATSFGEGWTFNRFNLQGQLLFGNAYGQHIEGQTFGIGVRLGPVDLRSNWFHTKQQSFVTHTATEHFWRLQLSQSLTGRNVSLGGGFYSNRLSMSLEHQVVFVPGIGFKQAELVNLTVRIHDTTISGGTVVDPFGNVRWTSYGTDFIQTGLQMAGDSTGRIGGPMLDGYVRDRDGKPVEGIAARFGKAVSYSNVRGYIQFHAKHGTHAQLVVDLNDSVAPGVWKVVGTDVQPNAQAGKQIAITVERAF